MRKEKLDKLFIEELTAWKSELEKEVENLENGLDDEEEKLERIRTRYTIAKKAFDRTSIEMINENHAKPLYDELIKLQEEYDKKSFNDNQKINANLKLIEHIQAKINVRA